MAEVFSVFYYSVSILTLSLLDILNNAGVKLKFSEYVLCFGFNNMFLLTIRVGSWLKYVKARVIHLSRFKKGLLAYYSLNSRVFLSNMGGALRCNVHYLGNVTSHCVSRPACTWQYLLGIRISHLFEMFCLAGSSSTSGLHFLPRKKNICYVVVTDDACTQALLPFKLTIPRKGPKGPPRKLCPILGCAPDFMGDISDI